MVSRGRDLDARALLDELSGGGAAVVVLLLADRLGPRDDLVAGSSRYQ